MLRTFKVMIAFDQSCNDWKSNLILENHKYSKKFCSQKIFIVAFYIDLNCIELKIV